RDSARCAFEVDRRGPIAGPIRRGGRVAEGARLESVFTGNRNVGSNPTPSAKPLVAFCPDLYRSQDSAESPLHVRCRRQSGYLDLKLPQSAPAMVTAARSMTSAPRTM